MMKLFIVYIYILLACGAWPDSTLHSPNGHTLEQYNKQLRDNGGRESLKNVGNSLQTDMAECLKTCFGLSDPALDVSYFEQMCAAILLNLHSDINA